MSLPNLDNLTPEQKKEIKIIFQKVNELAMLTASALFVINPEKKDINAEDIENLVDNTTVGIKLKELAHELSEVMQTKEETEIDWYARRFNLN